MKHIGPHENKILWPSILHCRFKIFLLSFWTLQQANYLWSALACSWKGVGAFVRIPAFVKKIWLPNWDLERGLKSFYSIFIFFSSLFFIYSNSLEVTSFSFAFHPSPARLRCPPVPSAPPPNKVKWLGGKIAGIWTEFVWRGLQSWRLPEDNWRNWQFNPESHKHLTPK